MSMKSIIRDFPNGSVIKNSLASAGDTVRSLGREDPLEEEMITLSSILAWEISWTEEPCGLWSMGSQRVGHYTCTQETVYLFLTRRSRRDHTSNYK